MVATYIEKIMHNMICVTSGIYSKEIFFFFFASQVSGGLVKTETLGFT